MRYGVGQKFRVCIYLVSNGIRNKVHFWLYLYLCIQRAVHSPPPFFFPCVGHGISSFEIVHWTSEGRRGAVIIRTLVVESNFFFSRTSAVSCSVSSFRDFAHLKAWLDHTCFNAGKKEWLEKAQQTTQRHAPSVTRYGTTWIDRYMVRSK